VAEEMLYAAQKTRGKVRGALPRIPARKHPLRTRRLSLPLHVSERRCPRRQTAPTERPLVPAFCGVDFQCSARPAMITLQGFN
jgi:hypothetical protein